MKIHLPLVGTDLPVHPTLRHPRTGNRLRAIGVTRDGRAMWPVLGASPDDDADGSGDDAGDDDAGGQGDDGPDDLGDAGKQAIARMKAERNAARKELRGVQAQLSKLAPLQKLADALGAPAADDGQPDVEALAKRLSQHESELAAERTARYRAEVAAEKSLTAAQARRLVGTTREELAKDADELLKDFAQQQGDGRHPRTPRPDPSQGSRGGTALSSREQAIAEAQKRFGTKSTVT
jgi:hypothetical protein